MDCWYTSYGLTLVASRSIPGLARCNELDRPDVRVTFGQFPFAIEQNATSVRYRSQRLNPESRPNLIISEDSHGWFRFEYADLTEFLISSDGSEIWCDWTGVATIEDAAVHLRGPILGFVLRLRGDVCLHASAIAVDGSAIAIVAGSGGGKSTTAAAFGKGGLKILADDVVALRQGQHGLLALPAYPRVNLWPDSAETLYEDAVELPRLIPLGGAGDDWDKRYLDLEPDDAFQSTPLPLRAVYLLGDRFNEDRPPQIDRMSAQDAFIWLTDGTHVNYAIDDAMRQTEFNLLADLVRTIPVRLVSMPNDPNRVSELCDAILKDFSNATSELSRAHV